MATINLGGKSFDLKPLTIRQMKALEKLSSDPDVSTAGMAYAAEVIKIGLSRDHAGIDVEDLEANTDEIKAALRDIMVLGGFVKAGEATPGEAKAAASE